MQRFNFESTFDQYETTQWVNRIQTIENATFEEFEQIWNDLGSQDMILWDHLCSVLNFDSQLHDKMFPAEFVRSGFINLSVSDSESCVKIEYNSHFYANENRIEGSLSLAEMIDNSLNSFKDEKFSKRRSLQFDLYKQVLLDERYKTLVDYYKHNVNDHTLKS